MGSQFSKRKEQSKRGRPEGNNFINKNNNSEGGDQGVTPEAVLSSYEAACRAYPQLRSLEVTIPQRTSRASNSIAAGPDVGPFSLDFLCDNTECLLGRNQEVVSTFLQSKKDIWKNPELSDLVYDYLNNSLQSLDIFAALNSLSRIIPALQKFEEEHAKTEGSSNLYSKTLEELRNFKDACRPFTEEFLSSFQAVYKQQMLMCKKLEAKKGKVYKKLGRLETWKKVTNVIFVTAFVSVWICSVVAAAVTAPPLVTALTAAAAVPLGAMGKWLNYVWTKRERELKGHREIISSIELENFYVIGDLKSIRVLVDKLQIEIEALIQNADFAMTMREDEAVVIAMTEIKKKVDGFTKTIKDLSNHADKCSRDINSMRTEILRKIMHHLCSSNSGTNNDIGMFLS